MIYYLICESESQGLSCQGIVNEYEMITFFFFILIQTIALLPESVTRIKIKMNYGSDSLTDRSEPS